MFVKPGVLSSIWGLIGWGLVFVSDRMLLKINMKTKNTKAEDIEHNNLKQKAVGM